MALHDFAIDLNDEVYQAAQQRAQNEGSSLEQVLLELLENYGQGSELTTYTVQRGDTLATIAQRVYGDKYKYPVIQNANNIPDPGRIWVGQVLVIPPLAEGTPAPMPGPQPDPKPAPAPPTPPPSPPSPPQSPPQPEPAPAPAPSDEPALADYVRAMPQGLRKDRVAGLRGNYQFRINGQTWTLSIVNQSASVAEGQSGAPSVIIEMSQQDFIKLARGQLNTREAYQQRQIKVKGDLNLAAGIPQIFAPWAQNVEGEPRPAPAPSPAPSPEQPTPEPKPEAPSEGEIYPHLMNGSFDEYQPYHREDEDKVWKEPQFPERYGKYWAMDLIYERRRRIHVMDSGTFGRFTQKYFGGGGRDYHIHGKHSQVVTSRYAFDLMFSQTVAAEPGRDYTFSGAIVSFYKGTSGERADGKIFKTIGIDPTGGRDRESSNVVWGERDGKDNEWRYPSLKVKSKAAAITVFIRLENTEKDVGETELNIVHLDNFKLE